MAQPHIRRAARDMLAIVGVAGAESIAAEAIRVGEAYDRMISQIGIENTVTNGLLEQRVRCRNFARVLRAMAAREVERMTKEG